MACDSRDAQLEMVVWNDRVRVRLPSKPKLQSKWFLWFAVSRTCIRSPPTTATALCTTQQNKKTNYYESEFALESIQFRRQK